MEDPDLLNLLVEQIDLNRNGKIEYSELESFLWPAGESAAETGEREFGIILQYVRNAVKKVVQAAAANDSEEALLGKIIYYTICDSDRL